MDTETFLSSHEGDCFDCGNKKTLDSMIRINNTKGLYHCIDCETEQFNKYYFQNNLPPTIEQSSKINKMFKWCFG